MDKYVSPFSTRYASDEMQYFFSQEYKIITWRKLWIALAKAQKKLGLDITNEQIAELESFCENINYADANEHEQKVRHDVMAHIYAYGLQCKEAAPIIHLGATSAYVVDNTDLIILSKASQMLKQKILKLISLLKDFALEHKDLPTLGFTHFQPAQLTTVGKRASLWIHDLLLDVEELEFCQTNLKFLGSKGATGTQASFMELFGGDSKKVKDMEEIIASELGFKHVFPVASQTYSRKIDSRFANALGQIAQSASKFANDIRLLQHLKEVEEPFETSQVGSSAMAYKRNPMRCERINALSRHIIANMQNPAMTASAQWLERTLDDSANKRIAIAEGFLGADAVINIYMNVAKGLVVYPNMMAKHIEEELPFMATENIMMDGVKRGGDRQKLHEAVRNHAMEAAKIVKLQGGKNDILERIAKDPLFNTTLEDLKALLDPTKFTGRASEQVEEFIKEHVEPVLLGSSEFKNITDSLKV